MAEQTQHPQPSSALPDYYDRQLAVLHGLPDVVKTKASTVRTIPPLGIGGSHVFIIQSYRQRDVGDTIFLEMVSNLGAVRLVIPPKVTDLIARQRDALTAKTRSRAAQASADDRRARGITPGFLRERRKDKDGRSKRHLITAPSPGLSSGQCTTTPQIVLETSTRIGCSST